MSHQGDMSKLIKAVRKQGCLVERTTSSHWKITTPSGIKVIAAFSPSTAGGVRATIRYLQKAGVKL